MPTTKLKTSRIWYPALALLIGIGVSAELAALDLQGYRVTRPGEVLFRPAPRRAELATLPKSEVRAWCGAQRQRWPTHGISRNVYNGQQPGETFAWTMITGAAAAFALDDAAVRRAVIGNLTRWAQGDALGRFKKDPAASMYYNLDRTLFSDHRRLQPGSRPPDFPAANRAIVDEWLDRLVERRGPGRPKDPALMSSRNNHGYLSDSVTMAWGIVRGEDTLFRAGVASFVGALDQMRPDGSLPLETARDARALHYQRHAISSLVAIAEMAASQGHDLYRLESDKRVLCGAPSISWSLRSKILRWFCPTLRRTGTRARSTTTWFRIWASWRSAAMAGTTWRGWSPTPRDFPTAPPACGWATCSPSSAPNVR